MSSIEYFSLYKTVRYYCFKITFSKTSTITCNSSTWGFSHCETIYYKIYDVIWHLMQNTIKKIKPG